jgi:hypothetical protein
MAVWIGYLKAVQSIVRILAVLRLENSSASASGSGTLRYASHLAQE